MRTFRGFSLVEVVISLFVIGVTIVLATQMLTIMPLARHAKAQALALSITRNQMESIRAAGYASLPASGTFIDAQLASLPQAEGTVSIADYNLRTKQVAVTVSWMEGTATTSVSLATLVTEVGGI